MPRFFFDITDGDRRVFVARRAAKLALYSSSQPYPW
jgi:hypothetical protein